jgi:hypothetical protein
VNDENEAQLTVGGGSRPPGWAHLVCKKWSTGGNAQHTRNRMSVMGFRESRTQRSPLRPEILL